MYPLHRQFTSCGMLNSVSNPIQFVKNQYFKVTANIVQVNQFLSNVIYCLNTSFISTVLQPSPASHSFSILSFDRRKKARKHSVKN